MFFFCTSLLFASLCSAHAHSASGSREHAHRHLHRSIHRRAEKALDFGYVGEQGPLGWTGIVKDNFECSTNHDQSPINFEIAMKPITEKPEVSFPSVASAPIINNGHTLEVEMVEGNGTTKFKGKTFNLQQFHFHTPSEHLSDGEFFPLEMHMVHEAAGEQFFISFFLSH
jgi:carbonic anhydrase